MNLRRILLAATVPLLFSVPLHAQTLSTVEQEIVRWIDAHSDDLVSFLEETVNVPSATTNLEGVRKVATIYAREFETIGMKTRWVDAPPELKRAGHLFAETKGSEGKRLLLIGHLDTVLEGPPMRIENGRAYGIGASDMKGGNAIILFALKALAAAGTLDDHTIVVALIGDEEEAGRPLDLARAPLIAVAKESDAAIAFEGTVENTATVARRGISSWRVEVTATTGHSSLIFRPSLGYGAVFEAARILDAFRQTLSEEQYLTFNPSVIVGGSRVTYDPAPNAGTAAGKTNVIADKAFVEGDLRFIAEEQRDAAREVMRKIVTTGNLPGTKASISFAEGYPSMAPREANYAILDVLDKASRDLGFGPVEALDPGRRGAGDISFVASHVASLDGLGAIGDREHAPDEYVELEPFPMLVKRAAILIHRLTEQPRGPMRRSVKKE